MVPKKGEKRKRDMPKEKAIIAFANAALSFVIANPAKRGEAIQSGV